MLKIAEVDPILGRDASQRMEMLSQPVNQAQDERENGAISDDKHHLHVVSYQATPRIGRVSVFDERNPHSMHPAHILPAGPAAAYLSRRVAPYRGNLAGRSSVFRNGNRSAIDFIRHLGRL